MSICSSTLVFSQERVQTHEPIIWSQATQKIAINDKNSLAISAQHRAFLERANEYHLLTSITFLRKLPDQFTFSTGLTNLNISQFVATDFVLVPELRPFQSIQKTSQTGKSEFSARLMVEERFFKNAAEGELTRGFTFNWRFRNKLQYNQHLTENWGLILSSEIMMNAGKNAITLFDQHRTQLLIERTFERMKIASGYMHWAVQGINDLQNRHTWMIILVRN